MKLAGAIPGSLETYLAVRGMRTLHLRLERGTATAHELATRLQRHPDVSVVRYPGLPTHPMHSTARGFMRSYGAMISFDVRAEADRAEAICESLQIIRHATSPGSVETTIERRGAVPGQKHLPPTLLRLSVWRRGLRRPLVRPRQRPRHEQANRVGPPKLPDLLEA